MLIPRRIFLQGLCAGAVVSTIPACGSPEASRRSFQASLTPLNTPNNQSSNWLGGHFWGNRLQDWRLENGQINCMNGSQSYEARTAHCLTHVLNSSAKPARLRTVVTRLTEDGNGIGGFLIGAGGGKLDYRQAALIQRGSGENGGILAVVDQDGALSLRDFSSTEAPLTFDSYEVEDQSPDTLKKAVTSGSVILDCHLDPVANDAYDIRLIAYDTVTGDELAFIVSTAIPASRLAGNIALFSSAMGGQDGTRFGFSDIEFGGDKIDVKPDQSLDEVMGCLHSLNQSVLKLTAQFMPVDVSVLGQARFDCKKEGSKRWTKGPVSDVGDGFTAIFRLEDWDSTTSFDYRITALDGEERSLFEGRILKDPGSSRPVKIALHSCLIPTARSLDNIDGSRVWNAKEKPFGRFSPKNLFFPHNELVENCEEHDPDIYFFCGDQYYETYPTRAGRGTEFVKIDTLYRWYLWFWTFRDAIRDKPCILLADDHDILQGNLWGQSGEDSDMPKEEDGGFKHDKGAVRMVYRMQCSHNPDSFDPTPILYDIPVTYGSFIFGGVDFAFVEDRKFKTAPDYETDPLKTKGILLGERQEKFLAEWGKQNVEMPHVCLTASVWGSPQTDPELNPLLDYDANGYPPDGRMRAVKLLRDANALALSGDQHLALVCRQGVDSHEDGPVFFAGPAGAAFWQRWFEGQGKLDNQFNNNPDSGNFTDTFGNKMRVMAVGNPKITHAEFDANNMSWGKFLSDRDLKTEGYAIIRVDHSRSNYELECWEWNKDPKTASQMDGWPITVPFKEAGRKL